MHRSNPAKATSSTCKNRPGPKGTSCMTCKRRHKKCDQRLPICQRCEKGGFECLGYDHISNRRIGTRAAQPPQPQRLIMPKPTEEQNFSSHASSFRLAPGRFEVRPYQTECHSERNIT
ncbi:unnamed protein product [Rhizoctonia solani]|uniref:Zn(2)-C6 fungal-type domain-containing protein n=1 Tax=Rhizoctonia solani TaxID=456999 RepID=A0A8H3DBD1_9AGAM|nr:unnamed protein product [Rhizoctonia solani]